ncbi:MAG: sugar transferase [Candidatus Lokiarchaeia archaeon]
MLKRLFDIVLSFVGILALSPLFLLVAILIKKEDAGPVFYRGLRVGSYGKPFKIFKFRTMVVGAEKLGGSSTPDDDLRITKIGKFLRKYKMDELPQLINVLKGEMSLVGPRPQVAWAVQLYSNEEKEILLRIKPGMTDHASIKFLNEGEILRGSEDPDKDYMEKIHSEKVRLSIEYAKNMSLKTDFKILFKTFLSIAKKEA